MKTLTRIILMSGILFFLSCEKEKLTTTTVYKSRNITIELLGYTDSRCPEGVNCIWEGEAAVDLKITDKNESVNFTLTGIGTDTKVLGHKVKFLDLLPYPKDGVHLDLNDIEVELQVSKF